MARIFSLPLALACALAACAPARHTGRLAAPVPFTSDQGEYTRRLRDLIRTELPQLATATGRTRFVYLRGDGTGRVVRALAEDTAPRPFVLPRPAVGRIVTAQEVDRWLADSTAAWGVLGMSMHAPGEVAADSVWVVWAEPPVPFAGVRVGGGDLPLGLLTAEQMTPERVRAFARRVPPGHTVWWVYDDQQRLLGYGTWPGADPDVEARRAELAPRFADGRLTCASALGLRGAAGRIVRVVPVRFQPRAATASASPPP